MRRHLGPRSRRAARVRAHARAARGCGESRARVRRPAAWRRDPLVVYRDALPPIGPIDATLALRLVARRLAGPRHLLPSAPLSGRSVRRLTRGFAIGSATGRSSGARSASGAGRAQRRRRSCRLRRFKQERRRRLGGTANARRRVALATPASVSLARNDLLPGANHPSNTRINPRGLEIPRARSRSRHRSSGSRAGERCASCASSKSGERRRWLATCCGRSSACELRPMRPPVAPA